MIVARLDIAWCEVLEDTVTTTRDGSTPAFAGAWTADSALAMTSA